MIFSDKQLLFIGGIGIAIAVFTVVKGKEIITDAVAEIGDGLNPTSSKNVANRAANAMTRAITGDPNQTLGGAIFDFFNPNAGK